MGVFGGMQQAAAQDQAAKAQEQYAQQQLAMGKLQQTENEVAAQNARLDAARQAKEAIHRRRIIEGQATAQASALGTWGGSSIDVLRDIGQQGAQEVSYVLSAGETTARGYQLAGGMSLYQARSGAIEAYNQAGQYRAQAGQSRIGAFGTLVSGAASTIYLRQQVQPRPFLRPNLGPPPRNPLIP